MAKKKKTIPTYKQITRANKKLDRLTQQNREQKPCEVCGNPATVIHHFVQKMMSQALRHDPKNHIYLCSSCHYKIHNNDASLVAIIGQKRGKRWLDYITKKKRETTKRDKFYLEELLKKIKNYEM